MSDSTQLPQPLPQDRLPEPPGASGTEPSTTTDSTPGGAHDAAHDAAQDAGHEAGYTDVEVSTLKRGAFGAIALVSKADPGFFGTFKESVAGSRALASAPPEVAALLREGGFVMPPQGTPEQVETQILADLGSAVATLRAKDPTHLDGYRAVVLAACDAVADASRGVAPEEAAVIDRVKSALA